MDNKQLTKKGGQMAKSENEYILVNLDCTMKKEGDWYETKQPEHLKKFLNKILITNKDYSETLKVLKKCGYNVMLNANDEEPAVDGSYGVHLLCEILPEDRKKYKTIHISSIQVEAEIEGSYDRTRSAI